MVDGARVPMPGGLMGDHEFGPVVSTLKPGNLGTHKSSAVALIGLLPAYVPDLNPIQQTFARIKPSKCDAPETLCRRWLPSPRTTLDPGIAAPTSETPDMDQPKPDLLEAPVRRGIRR